ncbi:MAG: peptidylprolyl isomerase [Verrucomicrobiales bacterium]|nr:peptidylprolyl isomerase [Verrucomicrobiales bacterium]
MTRLAAATTALMVLLAGPTPGCRTPKPGAPATAAPTPRTAAAVLSAARDSDWRRPDPARLLCLDLDRGRVVIELHPLLAPNHVANVLALAREGYYDGLAILRVQDNYVVQWGDADAEDPAKAKPIRSARRRLPAELDFALPARDAARFTPLPDSDTYAPRTGFLDGFPVAHDPATGRYWPVHAYGMVGAGRDNALDSGGGPELYAVIGQAPRHLDRNVTLFGRVLQGMEILSALPRGPAPMGFYPSRSQHVPIRSVRVASDLPESERPTLEVLRTDTPLFRQWIEARRDRREEWFHFSAGRLDVANLPIPVR